MTKDFTEYLKQNIKLNELIGQSVKLTESGDGWRGGHENKHESESGNCLWITGDRWSCFHCHEGGDALDWVASVHNLDIKNDFIKILGIAAEFAGVEMPKYEIPRVYTCMTIAAEYFNSCLIPPMYDEFLKKWGIKKATVDELKIGYCMSEKTKDGRSLMKYLLNKGFTEAEIVSTGIYRKDGRKYVQIFNSRYVFPYWKGDHVEYLIARRTSKTQDSMGKYVKLKTRGSKKKAKYISTDVKNILFGINSAKRGGEYCIITEGITDSIMAIQAGMPCLSPVTVRLSMKNAEDILPYVRMFKKVYICNDSEDNSAGLKGAIKTAHYLIDQGVDTRIVYLPRREGVEKVDLSNYLRENSVDAFHSLMDIATAPDKFYVPDQEDFFTDDGRFNITYFASWLLSEHSGEYFMSFEDSKPTGMDFYFYKDGVYLPHAANHIEGMIAAICGVSVSTQASKEVVKRIRRASFIDRTIVDVDPEVLNIKNGILNLRNMKISPHSPDTYSMVQLPRTYVTDQPDFFLDFLEDILPMKKRFVDQEVMLTMMGYCLLKSYPKHKFFLLYGTGNNGKGTLLHVISDMLGGDNVSSVSIQDLTDRFRPAELYNKMANICGDLSDKYVQDSSGLKTLTGEDTILAERKGEHPFEFKNHAKLLFATNGVPFIPDRDGSNAIYNRMCIVEFGEDFTDKMDTTLRDKLTQKDELDAIFSFACLYAQSILTDNDEPGSLANFGPDRIEMAERYREFRTTPTARFINEFIKYTGKTKDIVKQTELYNKYVKWYTTGHASGAFTGSPITSRKFNKMVRERLGVNVESAPVNGITSKVYREIVCQV